MTILSRRSMIGAFAAGGVGLAAGREALAQAAAPLAEPVRPPAFAGQHRPKPLPFDPARLRGLSERLLRSHWENNYGGAVRALNAVEQKLEAMMKDEELPAYLYGDVKREELARTGSVVLHEHYFANLGGDGKPSGGALELIKRAFGGLTAWESEFRRTANALAGGSGWVVLALNLHTREVHNYWASDHMHNAVMGAPLLVLDMYEHAYHIDFGAAAARYVDAFLDNVHWEEVNRRVAWALKTVPA